MGSDYDSIFRVVYREISPPGATPGGWRKEVVDVGLLNILTEKAVLSRVKQHGYGKNKRFSSFSAYDRMRGVRQ